MNLKKGFSLRCVAQPIVKWASGKNGAKRLFAASFAVGVKELAGKGSWRGERPFRLKKVKMIIARRLKVMTRVITRTRISSHEGLRKLGSKEEKTRCYCCCLSDSAHVFLSES